MFNVTKKKLRVAAVAQTVPSIALDPKLMDFCSRFQITPAITEFHDDENQSDHYAFNHSLDIKEESELKKFTQALQMAQIDALNNGKKRKIYTKHSKRTQKHRKNETIALVSKGFHPLEKHGFTVKHRDKMDHIIEGLPEESEEASDEANGPTQDPCVYSVTDTSEVESDESLPRNV